MLSRARSACTSLYRFTTTCGCSNVSDLIELYGEIAYVDLGSDADGTAVGAGVYYNVSDNVALGLGASVEDDVTAYGASVRFYFDKQFIRLRFIKGLADAGPFFAFQKPIRTTLVCIEIPCPVRRSMRKEKIF